MTTVQDHSTSNATSFAQKGAVAALRSPRETLREWVAEFAARKDHIARLLREIPGVTLPEPQGAFYAFANFSAYFGRRAGGLPGELALPSIHHGELDGFVLLGLKPNGNGYRPDETDVLGFAAHQVGLDFRALRMELLEREVTQLTIGNRQLQSINADLRMAVQRLSSSPSAGSLNQ